jgi:type IX secretion system PorP/SprF family membrane protein
MNDMKVKILLFSFLFVATAAFSQQEPQYTNFMFTKMAYNPGYAGINGSICGTLLSRQQWIGFQDDEGNNVAPRTNFLTIDALIEPLKGGIGFQINQDKIGFEENISVRLAYSFHLNVGRGKLGLGLQGGLINKNIDFSKFKPNDDGDPLLNSGNIESSMNFDMAFGAYYTEPRVMYAGISSTQLTQSVAEFSRELGSPEYKRHYYIMGGYFYQLPNNPSLEINPNALIKTDFAAAQYDLNVLVHYNKQIYAGVSYRVQDAVALLAGYGIMGGALDGLKAGIAYDLTTQNLGRNSRSFGSVEIYLNYCFDIVIPPKYQSHGNVRHFY